MRDTNVRWHWCTPARLALAVLMTAIVGPHFTPAAHAASNPADEEYSFDWLDPDKKVYVLQNRKFLKGGKLLVSAMGGLGLSETYRKSYSFDPRVAYYLNEALGIEAFYALSMNSVNGNFKALEESTTSLPLIREIQSRYGVLAHWSPWYAKINVFNAILYFDWYFTAGAGQMQTRLNTEDQRGADPVWVTQNLFAFYLGTGHQYHLSRNFIIRLDLTGAFYQAPIFGDTGEKALFSNFNFNVGAGFRF